MKNHAPTLGLSVIAKNAAGTLRACLKSVEGLVDAMVVVDTGSTDRTAEIARECGATVVLLPWTDDFSAARNATLAALGTDWVLVLDADEELDKKAHAWIRGELQAPSAEGYVVPVRNYLQAWDQPLTDQFPVPPGEIHPGAPNAKSYLHSQVCRLFRRDPDIYYIGHLHEQVEYRLMELGRPIAMAGFFIHHFGWYLIDDASRLLKLHMYYELIAEKMRQRPDDPQVLLQYGDALRRVGGQPEQGIACFMKAAALKEDDHTIWMNMAAGLLQIGQFEAALIAIARVPVDVDYAAGRFQLEAKALEGLERNEEALVAYRMATELAPDQLDIQARLALLEMKLGHEECGKLRMQNAIAIAEAQAWTQSHVQPFLRLAEMHAQVKQWHDVLRCSRAGLKLRPDLVPLHQLRLHAAIATESFTEAAEAAAAIAEINPEPRSIMRHAAVLNHFGKVKEAHGVITRGLELFPVSNELQQVERELKAMLPVATVPRSGDGHGMQAFALYSSPQA